MRPFVLTQAGYALGFGGAMEALRGGAEKQEGGVRGPGVGQEVEVFQQGFRSGPGLERETNIAGDPETLGMNS